MPQAIPEQLTVTKLKEAFTKVEGSGEVNLEKFGEILDSLDIQAKVLDRLLVFDFVDPKNAGAINYMQFYNIIKENVQKFGQCSASDLVLNLAMEHSMSRKGRKVRLDFKKRQTETPAKPPEASLPVSKKQSSKPSSPKEEEKNEEEVASQTLKESPDRSRNYRRQSNPVGLTVEKKSTRDRRNTDLGLIREDARKSKPGKVDEPFVIIEDFDFNPKPNRHDARASADSEDDDDKLPQAFRIDSAVSDDMFKREFSPRDEPAAYPERPNNRSQGHQQFDSLEDTMAYAMAQSKRAIMGALKEHLSSEMPLLKEIKKLAIVGPKSAPAALDSNVDLAKDDVHRLLKKVSSIDLGQFNEEIDLVRKDLRALRDEQNLQTGPEMQRTLESVQQLLSNIEDNIAFNLGTKVDHLESKLNKILTLVTKDKPSTVDPQTEAELRDERKRLREAMKFIESQVKKFKTQKSDYKNQIRLASEKIRKERKQLSREKERIRKETNVMEQEKSDIKDRMHQVSRAQRKLSKRKASGMYNPMDNGSIVDQLEEVEIMKETCAKQNEQLIKLKTRVKEDRKKLQEALNQLKKKNKYLENEKIDLHNDLTNTTSAIEEGTRKIMELEKQVTQLQDERVDLVEQKGAMRDAELQGKESIEKEREYLAKMKQKLQDLAQKLTEERNNNETAVELDKKAKTIATQMQLLADERETLYTEREQFEAERNAVLAVWRQKEKELKKQDQAIQAMREKKDAQAKIMRQEWPRFKSRQHKLEEQEQQNEENETSLRKNKATVEKRLNELKERAAKLELQKADIASRSKKLIEKETLVKELGKKVETMKDELTVTKTKLQVKQDALETITRDFERAAKKGKTDNRHVKLLISEEQARLRKEFDAEKKAMEKEFNKKVAGKIDEKELRKKGEQLIQEEKLVLEQERERIRYLAEELHKTMDDLEKEKKEFEQEKRKWIKVIEDITEDESVVKQIQKMFEREKGKKKK